MTVPNVKLVATNSSPSRIHSTYGFYVSLHVVEGTENHRMSVYLHGLRIVEQYFQLGLGLFLSLV